ncbi:MAG: hypothetical protein IT435_00230 [Phycisphaerales bacterium]|nr:hypothetical protein [Phycisphaerales bacterium]
MKNLTVSMLMLAALAPAGLAQTTVSGYDDLAEGFLGTSLAYKGITYSDVNGVDGVFPDGSTFLPSDTGNGLFIEDSTYLFDDFPGWASPANTMTFGTVFIPGPNLSLGAFSRMTMTLDDLANAASVEMAFYENGPWGGIQFHLEARRNGALVATESLTIANNGGRDNVTTDTLAVSGVYFDTLNLFATYGSEYSAPRLIIDDLTITVPSPAAALVLLPLAALRRRR